MANVRDTAASETVTGTDAAEVVTFDQGGADTVIV